jgi:hypothetical protein
VNPKPPNPPPPPIKNTPKTKPNPKTKQHYLTKNQTQIMATVDALARMALTAWRELRALSLRDLLRSLLLILSDRLESGGGGGHRVGG